MESENRTYATLTPANDLTKLAFSDVYETLSARRQDDPDNGNSALRRMAVDPKQVYNAGVLRLRLETDQKVSKEAYNYDGETSESLEELDSDVERHHKELGMIWDGHYRFELRSPPAVPERGLTGGKGPLDKMFIDLLFCTKSFARWHSISLRNPHVRFNFSTEHKGLYIIGCSRSSLAQVTVNGESAAQRPCYLNQHRMKIGLDKLEYVFEWTEFSATDKFIEEREAYVTRSLGRGADGDAWQDDNFDMPTPLPSRRTIGQWTLAHTLGKGGQGKVLFASNTRGEIAAVKLVERTSRNSGSVDAEVRIYEEVTAMAKECDEDRRIIRLVEVLYTDGKRFSSEKTFDDVAFVLAPVTPLTLSDLIGARSRGGSQGMRIEAASVFRDALKAIKTMHDNSWLHLDLKPPNIERELVEYDATEDIWAMGVILYQLSYARHPWKFAINPWRREPENEMMRKSFRENYDAAVLEMTADYATASQSPAKGYIHLGSLFVKMVRYRWAPENHARRPDIDEVLRDPAWGPFLGDSEPGKRLRSGNSDDNDSGKA